MLRVLLKDSVYCHAVSFSCVSASWGLWHQPQAGRATYTGEQCIGLGRGSLAWETGRKVSNDSSLMTRHNTRSRMTLLRERCKPPRDPADAGSSMEARWGGVASGDASAMTQDVGWPGPERQFGSVSNDAWESSGPERAPAGSASFRFWF